MLLDFLPGPCQYHAHDFFHEIKGWAWDCCVLKELFVYCLCNPECLMLIIYFFLIIDSLYKIK